MKTGKIFNSLILLILLVSACCKKEEPSYKPVPAGEIRIGALLSLTGGGYSTGQSSQISLDMARQDIMTYLKALAIDKTVTLEVVDTKTDTAEALKQLKALYEKGIRLVIGPYSSAEVEAIKSFADSHGILIVSPSSVAVSLAIPNDNIFRFVSSDVIQGKAMTKMLLEDKIKTIVPLVRDDLWGRDLLVSTRTDFTAAGGTVQTPVMFPPQTTEVFPLLSKLDSNVAAELKHHGPTEVAVYLLTLSEGSLFLHEAKNLANLNNVFWYGSSAFAQNASMLTDSTAGGFASRHGLPCPIFGLDDAAKDKWQPLSNRIQAETGHVPDSYAFTAYDALWVSVLSYLKAGISPDIEFLKSVFMLESDNFFGVSGNTALDVNGDRAIGNYDFWAVKRDANGYSWKKVAKYNSMTDQLTRVVK
jgi:branched-chain amino acid transport system substrate-binding protein